ncbi:MAG TPA: DivIVA domain-containing protein [Marmoricola sp.]|nr:DivIVA domain-containing protein [Marmoricola sp.]
MSWFFAVLVVLAIGGVVVVAAGRGDALAPEYDDRPEVSLPQRPLTGDDLREIRFSTAVRGYRASEVDALLERLAVELDLRPDGPDTAH